ncbi:MAG: phage terminase large subunit [Candidatus Kapabacteria bacterium]|nr:phage terminase large subunit [Candidatus Kapabacteria bacterium]
MKNLNEFLNSNFSPALTAYFVSKGKYRYPKHIAYLDSALLKAASGKIKRLMINLPPRHGKSELMSKYFPFWYLGKFPDRRIILSSYESTYAQSWGRKVRNLVSEFGEELFDVKLSDSSSAAGYFEIEGHGGSMTCVGAGGPITGKGADLFIIDDPIKNDEEANSSHQREKLWDWFRSTAYTRLEPDGIMIIMMTRWHEDDLCGRILSEFSNIDEKWEVITIPAIAGLDDPLGRMQGEALWEKRFSLEKLRIIEKSVGSYWFNSLYQQNPVSAGGGIFKKKHFRYFITTGGDFVLLNGENQKLVKSADCTYWAALDLAISLSSNADYTVAVVVAVTPDNELLICDVIRKHIEPSGHLDLIRDIYEKYRPVLIGIESVQYQTALVQSAAMQGFPVKPLKPDSDKLTRALPMAAKIETGTVYFNRDANWLQDFESELTKFPRDKHDDQVDALSYTGQFLRQANVNMPISGRKNR